MSMRAAIRSDAGLLVDLTLARLAGELREAPPRVNALAAVKVVAVMAATMAGPGETPADLLRSLRRFLEAPA